MELIKTHDIPQIGSEEQREAAEKLLRSHLEMIDSHIDLDVNEENVQEVSNHGMRLAELIGFSANCCARAEQILKHKEMVVLMANKDLYAKPTILSKVVSSSCYEQWALVTWADRLNGSIRHKMDFYRTIISKWKTEAELSLRSSQQQQSQRPG